MRLFSDECARFVFAADLDGDGDADVLSGSKRDNKIAWFASSTLNDCNGNRVLDSCEADVDGDGVTDECDFCAGGAASGDVDANGVVDLDDFADLERCLGGPDVGVGVGCACFDFDDDDDYDLQDFASTTALFLLP